MSHLYILLYPSWLSLKQNFVAEVLLERNLRSILVEEPLIWYIWSYKVRIPIWSESRLYCFPDLKSCKQSQIDVILGELWRGSTKEAFSLKPVRAGKVNGWWKETATEFEQTCEGALLRGSTQYSVETSPDPISPCRSCAFMCFHVSPHSMGLLLLWWTTHSQCKAAMQIICCFLVKVKHIAFCFVLVTLVLFFIRW